MKLVKSALVITSGDDGRSPTSLLHIPRNRCVLLKINMETVIKSFEKKGWALYKVTEDNNANLEAIVKAGKAKNFDTNTYYTILPLVAQGHNLKEIIEHLEVAKKTHQQPQYRAGGRTFALDGIEIVDGICYLHPSDSTHFRLKVERNNIEHTIQLAISNYNTSFFSSIEELLEAVGTPSQGKPILPKQLRWEFTHKDNSDLIILYPSDPTPIFFRGQNERHKPCYPSISRKISTHDPILKNLARKDQILICVRMIKAHWFCGMLELTPHYQWYKEQNIWMDKLALAQHYELPTGLMDLTQSIDVASFFACCKYDSRKGSWSAMKSGEGIIYALDYKLVPIESRKVRAIGQQVFPRPSEQWGWTFEMNLNEDFDVLPYVRKFIFLHNEVSSSRILEKFSHGKDLFPFDPLFKLATKIKDAKELPIRIVNEVLADIINDEKGMAGYCKDDLIEEISLQYRIQDNINLIDKELSGELKESWDNRKGDFINNLGVGFRMVRTKG